MRRRYVFGGRVQGVGFRFTARALAARYPVSGWVRNEDDGSVMLEVQGEPGNVEGFIAELQGQMKGKIQSATHQEVAEQPGQAGFVIRH